MIIFFYSVVSKAYEEICIYVVNTPLVSCLLTNICQLTFGCVDRGGAFFDIARKGDGPAKLGATSQLGNRRGDWATTYGIQDAPCGKEDAACTTRKLMRVEPDAGCERIWHSTCSKLRQRKVPPVKGKVRDP